MSTAIQEIAPLARKGVMVPPMVPPKVFVKIARPANTQQIPEAQAANPVRATKLQSSQERMLRARAFLLAA